MNINLDEKRIKSIEYELADGSIVTYIFKNGEISHITEMDKVSVQKPKTSLTDREMIETVKKSEFMGELEDARQRFKVDKTIADTFPDEDPVYGRKIIDRKYSDESLEAVKKIIEMDKNGKLDEILKRNSYKLNNTIKEELKEYNSELSDDLSACERNMRTIEEKILSRLRMNDENASSKDELKKLIEDYRLYKNKKKAIGDKMWDIEFPKTHPVNVTEELKKE